MFWSRKILATLPDTWLSLIKNMGVSEWLWTIGKLICALETTANQLPYQPTLFQCLGGKTYFANVDNLWGYNQAENSSKVTAIITPWGVYRFLACPFGISTAPGQYQARMAHVVLKDFYLNGAIFYSDDTVIYGRNVEEFLDT